jgi:2-methylcitrate synthase/citrate synthase II
MAEVEIKKGLVGVIADETKVSEVMPDINSLTYRGYAVQDLAEVCTFEEVAYLLLKGELPNKSQLSKFQEKERNNREISENLKKVIENYPKNAHPMDTTRTSVSHLGLEDSETSVNTIEANYNKFIKIFAKTPTVIAANFRTRKELDIINPKIDLSFSENFFHMCFGKVPSRDVVKAFDVSLILYAEHSFNASTFTSRVVTSTLADIYSAIVGGISALKGPLHGGANEAVMEMFLDIKEPENAEKYILNKIKIKDLIIGFGHRIYKKGDSRVPTMTKYYYKTAEFYKNDKFPKISKILEQTVIKEKNIFPNLDFSSGPTYYLMGFDINFFTPIFVMSRITGWVAHINEQLNDNKLIRPLSKYTGSKHRKVMNINSR